MASTDTPPQRRFLPQPVETTTRSSKRQHLDSAESSMAAIHTSTRDETMVPTAKPRRFAPQPIEETKRSSRRKITEPENDEASHSEGSTDGVKTQHTQSDDSMLPGYPTSKPSGTSRRFAPEPVETTARTSRRFAPEPVETTRRERRFAPEPVETTTRSSGRKFAVEPVETTSRSSEDKKEKATATSARTFRKFAPEPVETTAKVRHRRRKVQDEDSDKSASDSESESSSRVSSRQSSSNRKFSPELIETAKATYRHKGSDSPGTSPKSSSQRLRPTSPSQSQASGESSQTDDPSESRFSAAALAKRRHKEHRQHSYCVPDLPIIESESSSDEDSPPSLTDTPSLTDGEQHKLGKIEESNRESYTDYVFSLNNSRDRKRLQEAYMAAYINGVPHEPVAHFGIEEDEDDLLHLGVLATDDGADPKTFRRSSQEEHDWEMENMRKHHEQLEKAKKDLQADTCGASRFSAAALAARHHLGQYHKQPAKTKKQKDEDTEIARMRKAASPPMLGDDLVFPYTISPKMTRCDVDQAPRPRRADSDDSDRMSTDSGPQQLWSAHGTSTETSAGVGLWMGTCKKPSGLWMGTCQRGSEPSRPTTPTRSGIQTPAYESANPFESQTPGGRGSRTPGRRARPYGSNFLLPMTPPRSSDGSVDEFTSSIDKKLQLEKQIEEEFTPRVVTQIYNYLSLGFPSLARDFDAELSKISRIPIQELRKDDELTTGTIRGHVGAPESESNWGEDEDGTVRGCRRWDALKVYVKEWARQSPNFTIAQRLPVKQDPGLAHVKSVKPDAWGMTVRKGSWAQ